MLAKAIARAVVLPCAITISLAAAVLLVCSTGAHADGPVIEYVSHQIVYDSINNDGVANPGESVYVVVTIKNTGSYTAFELQGSLYTLNFYAECLGATNYGNVGPGEEKSSGYQDLYFRLSPLTPDGNVIELVLWLTDDEAHQFFPSFDIPVVDSVGPAVTDVQVSPKVTSPGSSVTLSAKFLDYEAIPAVTATVRSSDNTFNAAFPMYDDGAHGDGGAGDRVFGAIWNTPTASYDFIAGFQAVDGLGNYREHPDKIGFSNRPFSRHSTILVVIDELNEPSFDAYYTSALAANGFAYDLWHPFYRGIVPAEVILNYVTGIVIWATPEQGIVNDVFDASARETLMVYLDEGGKLFLTGQDIGYYIHDHAFYRDYLHAQFAQDSVGLGHIRGFTGDPIGDGLVFSIAGTGTGAGNQSWPSEINPVAPAEAVFEYYTPAGMAISKLRTPKPKPPLDGDPMPKAGGSLKTALRPPARLPAPEQIQPQGVISSGTAALRLDNDVYKVVYFAFGFEGIDDVDDRNAVMGKVVEWLHGRSTFEKTLEVGWNLVSLPVIPDSAVITEVLASVAGKYTLVQHYDAISGTWKSYDPALPPEASDLLALDERTPFWIQMAEAGGLSVPGLLPISTDQELKTGWNMVAYPCSETRTIANALVSIGGKYTKVLRYEAGAAEPWKRYADDMPVWAMTLTDMTPGYGYWVYATQDCTLTIVN